VTYGGDIFNNLFGEKKTIALGDCVDVNYIGRYASNNTIFESSYTYPTNKTGGMPLKVFVSTNTSESSPTGYENYTNLIDGYYVKGFIEGLVGLKEGQTSVINISAENAYGVYPKIGDVITVSDPSSSRDIKIVIVNITENASMPADHVESYGNGTTTLFVLRFDIYALGEKMTRYPSWENATVVTKINDTKMWAYTTPPEDKRENFTWISVSSDGYTEIVYGENVSSVTSINDTTIVITHNPQIGATMTYLDYYHQTTTYFTVVNLTDEKINVSYVDESTGAISYDEFDRTVTIVRNESQNITETLTTPDMDYFLSVIIKSYVPNSTLSVNKLAGESLIFEVQIVKIYKTS
jgi:FKBP-type peptidyl-prolyl cis-trans isomerase 2